MIYTSKNNFSSHLLNNKYWDTTYKEYKCIRTVKTTDPFNTIFKFNQKTFNFSLIEKYLYLQKSYSLNSTSLTSVEDGDPVIFFVNGDYTIPAGTTITPTNRCKGLYMFINGTLTNNGTISMTARGSKGEGKFVGIDLMSNFAPNVNYSDNNIHINRANGQHWIGNITGSIVSNNNTFLNMDGVNNACGTGGRAYTDGGINSTNSRPGNGTSFSGGSGGGRVSPAQSGTAGQGAPNGGQGGNGTTRSKWYVMGGSGNPAGTNYFDIDRGSVPALAGTGGLIIIIAKSIINNGTIVSNGSRGAGNIRTNSSAHGTGGSGGGSIQLFYSNYYENNGTIICRGGYGGNTLNWRSESGYAGSQKPGYDGGNGSLRIIRFPAENIL